MLELYEKFLISETTIIRDAMAILGELAGKGLVVVDKKKKLLGTLTDGDIRRGILNGFSISDKIENIMCGSPTCGTTEHGLSDLARMARDKDVRLIPIVYNGIVCDIYFDRAIRECNIPVVLMAGGLGSRLGELTKDCPKPMLNVGGKPVLERIIDGFTDSGFRKFYISVNYKREIIEDYFRDGADFNCEVNYLREDTRLGTAGALSLLPEDISGPIVLMNGDLLTQVDFMRLVDFHNSSQSKMTMCVRQYDFQVPYGVVNMDKYSIVSLDEKPVHNFFVNAGIYIIDSSLLHYIPKGQYFDITQFLNVLLKNNISAKCFPILEKWIDIGQAEDLHYARSFYCLDNK